MAFGIATGRGGLELEACDVLDIRQHVGQRLLLLDGGGTAKARQSTSWHFRRPEWVLMAARLDENVVDRRRQVRLTY